MNKAQFEIFEGALEAISVLREQLGWEPLPVGLREEWRREIREAEFQNTNGLETGGDDVELSEN